MTNIPSKLLAQIRTIPDFPKAGILFYDITTLLASPEHFRLALDCLEEKLNKISFDFLAGIDSRGFIFSSALADRMGKGLILLRKKGKLPGRTLRADYGLEYGTDSLEVCEGAITQGSKVAIVDDLLATGGTAKAGGELIKRSGGSVAMALFLMELIELGGRKTLNGFLTESIIKV